MNLLQLFVLNFSVAEHKLISLVLSSCGLRRIFIGLFNCILNATGDKHHFRTISKHSSDCSVTEQERYPESESVDDSLIPSLY